MDKLNSRCKEVTKEYKEKYDKLLSLVNGYEIASDTQNKNMQELSEIIGNTKQLISESDFNELKNEQHNIMKDFFRLEQMKDEPYSNDSQEFLRSKNSNDVDKKSEVSSVNQNNLDNIKKKFSIDSIQDISIDQKEKHKKSLNEQKPKQPQPQPHQLVPQPLIINPSDKNYQVLSNYQGSTHQIPSIQIVNVQEAPKCSNDVNKPDLNSTVNKVLEKSVSKPSKKFKPSFQNNSDSNKVIELIDRIKTPKIKKQVDKIIRAKKTTPNYFNKFIEDYTLHMKLPTNKKSSKKGKTKPMKIVNSKKCHKSKFIPNINNSSNNHSLF